MSGTTNILRGVTVCVIDDDPNLRSALGTALRGAGCTEIIQTADATRAMENIASRSIDLIVMEPRLVSLGGVGFVARLRQTAGCKQLPVLIVTASDNGKDAFIARQFKVASWVMKPATSPVLLAHALAALGKGPAQPRTDRLGVLAGQFEEQFVRRLQDLAQLVGRVHDGHRSFEGCSEEILTMLHSICGEARLLGYSLVSDLGGVLMELQRVAVRQPGPVAPMQSELIRQLRIGTSSIAMLGEKRMLGDGGSPGHLLLTHLMPSMQDLQGRMNAAAEEAEAEARATRDAMMARKQDLENESWRLKRAVTIDDKK